MNSREHEISKSINDLEFQFKLINIMVKGLRCYQGIALLGLIILVILNIFYNYTVTQNILSALCLILILICGWYSIKVYERKLNTINLQIQDYLIQLKNIQGI
jgi:uncharacterized membrane protein YqjE